MTRRSTSLFRHVAIGLATALAISVLAAGPAGAATTVASNTCALYVNDVWTMEGDSGSHQVNFTIDAAGHCPSDGVPFSYATRDGGATAGSDYVAVSSTAATLAGSLTFAPGESTKSAVVQVLHDTSAEPFEQFAVTLFAPAGGSLTDNRAIGSIVDDDGDPPPPTLAIDDVAQVEGDSGPTTFAF